MGCVASAPAYESDPETLGKKKSPSSTKGRKKQRSKGKKKKGSKGKKARKAKKKSSGSEAGQTAAAQMEQTPARRGPQPRRTGSVEPRPPVTRLPGNYPGFSPAEQQRMQQAPAAWGRKPLPLQHPGTAVLQQRYPRRSAHPNHPQHAAAYPLLSHHQPLAAGGSGAQRGPAAAQAPRYPPSVATVTEPTLGQQVVKDAVGRAAAPASMAAGLQQRPAVMEEKNEGLAHHYDNALEDHDQEPAFGVEVAAGKTKKKKAPKKKKWGWVSNKSKKTKKSSKPKKKKLKGKKKGDTRTAGEEKAIAKPPAGGAAAAANNAEDLVEVMKDGRRNSIPIGNGYIVQDQMGIFRFFENGLDTGGVIDPQVMASMGLAYQEWNPLMHNGLQPEKVQPRGGLIEGASPYTDGIALSEGETLVSAGALVPGVAGLGLAANGHGGWTFAPGGATAAGHLPAGAGAAAGLPQQPGVLPAGLRNHANSVVKLPCVNEFMDSTWVGPEDVATIGQNSDGTYHFYKNGIDTGVVADPSQVADLVEVIPDVAKTQGKTLLLSNPNGAMRRKEQVVALTGTENLNHCPLVRDAHGTITCLGVEMPPATGHPSMM